MSAVIQTRSGRYVDLLDPAPADFALEDIAHALAHTCRFSGHCSRFYSVAEHSLRVADLVPDDLRAAALMHDAAEAYVGDVTRPLKRQLPQYRAIEDGVTYALRRRFGLPTLEHPAIAHADLVMLATERRDLMTVNGHWEALEGIEPNERFCEGWWPDKARQLFLIAAETLGLK